MASSFTGYDVPEDEALMASLKNGMPKTTVMRESGSLQAKTSPINAVFASNDKDNDSVSAGDSNDNHATKEPTCMTRAGCNEILIYWSDDEGPGGDSEPYDNDDSLSNVHRKDDDDDDEEHGFDTMGFHANCFVVVHHPEAVKTHWPELYELA